MSSRVASNQCASAAVSPVMDTMQRSWVSSQRMRWAFTKIRSGTVTNSYLISLCPKLPNPYVLSLKAGAKRLFSLNRHVDNLHLEGDKYRQLTSVDKDQIL